MHIAHHTQTHAHPRTVQCIVSRDLPRERARARERGEYAEHATKIRSRRRPLLYCGSEASSLPHHSYPQTRPPSRFAPYHDETTHTHTGSPPEAPSRRQPPPLRQVPSSPAPSSRGAPHPLTPRYPGTPLFNVRLPRLGPVPRRIPRDRRRPTERPTQARLLSAIAKNTPRAFTHMCLRAREPERSSRSLFLVGAFALFFPSSPLFPFHFAVPPPSPRTRPAGEGQMTRRDGLACTRRFGSHCTAGTRDVRRSNYEVRHRMRVLSSRSRISRIRKFMLLYTHTHT